MLIRASLLAGSQLLDLLTLMALPLVFGEAVFAGEYNALAPGIFAAYGLAGIASFKLLGMGVSGFIAFGHRLANSRPLVIGTYIASAIGLIGAFANVLSFGILAGWVHL